jgi:hypothetical protein
MNGPSFSFSGPRAVASRAANAHHHAMAEFKKYRPSMWRDRLHATSIGVHLLLPAALLAPIDTALELAGWGLTAQVVCWAVLGAGYLGYIAFALILHLEFYPEKFLVGVSLLFWPAVLGLVSLSVFDEPIFAAGAAGATMFAGLELAVAILFFAGTKFGPATADLPPGQSALQWRSEGRMLWTDADFSAMTRWTMLGAFVLPGAAATAIVVAAFVALLEQPLWPMVAAIAAIGLTTYGYMRVLAGLTDGGRIFGPGRQAFD